MKDFVEKMGKKNMIMIFGFLLLIILVLFGGAFVYNKFFYKKSFSEIEEIMLKASENYFEENESKLPSEINATTTVPASTLVKSEKMKSISEYIRNDSIKCTGSVIVTNLGSGYRYTSNLDCGAKYKTKYFIDYLKESVKVVDNGNGLYNLNNELIFRGDDLNNFVSFYSEKTSANNKYRIIKITDSSVVLIYNGNLDNVVWDDRYNSQIKDDTGINDYNVSRVKKTLQDFYDGDNIFNSYAKNLIVTHKVGIGKRGNNDTDKTGSLENSIAVENQYLTLLPIYDFMNASNDSECKTTISRACQNYNYLSLYTSSWWTATADKNNSDKVYKVSGKGSGSGGYVLASNAVNNAKPRFVVYTAKDALYISGDGSESDPYVIK